MTSFEQAKKELLIKEAHELLSRAEFLVTHMINLAKNADQQKAA